MPDEAISVSVDDGRVSLGGEVGYLYQRKAAVDAVSGLIGSSTRRSGAESKKNPKRSPD